MDLRRIQDREDWSPDCENLTASVTSNRFNFTMRSVNKTEFWSENVTIFFPIRAVVANPGGDIFVGGWSRPITLPAVCQSEYCWAVVLRQEISNLLIELVFGFLHSDKVSVLAHTRLIWEGRWDDSLLSLNCNIGMQTMQCEAFCSKLKIHLKPIWKSLQSKVGCFE